MICGGQTALAVADLERAVRFYVETLGMKLVEHRPEDGVSVLDAGDGFRIALDATAKSEAAGRAAFVSLRAKSPLAETVAIFENRGVAFELRSDAFGAGATFHDPDGNRLTLRGPA